MEKNLVYAFKVDSKGFIIDAVIIEKGFEKPDEITTPIPTHVIYKPKWTGTEWIEGATQEEIDELTKVEPSPPTEMDLLKQRLTITENALVELILGGM